MEKKIEKLTAAEQRNVRQLFRAISFTPKERKTEDESDKYVKDAKNNVTEWTYTFASEDLKSPSLLFSYLKREGLNHSVVGRGIMVKRISNAQINKARKIANKKAKQFAITL